MQKQQEENQEVEDEDENETKVYKLCSQVRLTSLNNLSKVENEETRASGNFLIPYRVKSMLVVVVVVVVVRERVRGDPLP